MEKPAEFDEIRPYLSEELPQVLEELIADPEFRRVACLAIPGVSFEAIAQKMRLCKTSKDFQEAFCYGILWGIAKKYTQGLMLDHSSLKDKSRSYTYISNHRDIILDSGFLSILLAGQGMETVEIAIGDNLLIYPWIKKLVRVNKSFIVQRALGMRQMLESSARLSRYIHYAIAEKKTSLWIAQREGRAKDSNDRTQDSLLKMLAMGGEGDLVDRLKSLNIAPLSMSYEYDPCDYLKAQEFQLKRDIQDYKKSDKDDLKNMETGLFGYKGRVCFRTGNCLNDALDKLDRSVTKQELFSAVANLVDHEIHRNYTIYPGNYVAHDLLSGAKQFADKYTPEEQVIFEKYLDQRIDKIELSDKDAPFLRKKLLEMYANPLTNYLAAL